ncbi:hypothetical protein HYV79_01150 [Candidatus Woesearchaeota archaeon]|nr:hypothetical protein [Candidatus Woesearchaeota archaeon]
MKVCEGCQNYKLFKEKCWFYWENKRICTQYRESFGQEPEFKTAKENFL